MVSINRTSACITHFVISSGFGPTQGTINGAVDFTHAVSNNALDLTNVFTVVCLAEKQQLPIS
jgi:hypothetical protein